MRIESNRIESNREKRLKEDESEVTENEKYTKLNPSTLSVVFAPNVLQDGDPNANPFDTTVYEAVNNVFKDVCLFFLSFPLLSFFLTSFLIVVVVAIVFSSLSFTITLSLTRLSARGVETSRSAW